MSLQDRKIWLPVVIGALGYFVDIFDLVLFSILRVPSLKSFGLADQNLLNVGVTLLNAQMGGMLIGGVLWGMLGDKKGRVSVLFGSILLYSLANIANGFVTSVEMYAILRFLSGVGLAGELGAAITLVSEVLPTHVRGYGTAIVAGVGLSGAIFAGLMAEHVEWRNAYIIGGSLGLCLLVLRIGLLESGLFTSIKSQSTVRRGELAMLFKPLPRFFKYLCCIGVGVPIWYVAGILMTFSPEITHQLGIEGVIAGKSIMYSYLGVAIGDLMTGFLSQWVKSRRKVVMGAIAMLAVFAALILFGGAGTASGFYWLCFWIGLATGYWAVFVTIAAEQFGTNLRSTVTTSVPNFVRGSVVPLTLVFRALGGQVGLIYSAAIVGLLTVGLAAVSIYCLKETYSKDMNFLEV